MREWRSAVGAGRCLSALEVSVSDWVSLDEASLLRSYEFQAPDGRRFFGVFRNFDGRRIVTVYPRRLGKSGVEVRSSEAHFELPLRPGWLCRLVDLSD